MQTTINAQTIINTVTAAAAIAPEFNESERVQNEFHHSARYMRVYFDDETPPAVTNAARAEAYSEFLRCNPTPPPKIKIQTSARGYMTIQNTRERLEQLAATVRRNAAAFGGGLLKIAKPRAAITWPAGAVKMVRELIQDHDYAGALDLAGAKCGAMFYQHQKAAFMLLAPVECAEIPGMMSAQNEKGHFVVFEPVSGFEIGNINRSKNKTRAHAIQCALYTWDTSTNQAAAIAKACATPCDQQAARLAWMTEHGIQTQEDINARIEAAAAQDVAQVIEAATMAAQADTTTTDATEQTTQAPAQVRELATAGEYADDTSAGQHAGPITPPPARHTPQHGSDYTDPRETSHPAGPELHDTARDLDAPRPVECAYSEVVFCTPSVRYGKTLWTLCVYLHARYGACTGYSWFDERIGFWRQDKHHPRYDGDDTYNGLPLSLGKLYDAHKTTVTALIKQHRAPPPPKPTSHATPAPWAPVPEYVQCPPQQTGVCDGPPPTFRGGAPSATISNYTTQRETLVGVGLHHTPQDLAPHNDPMSFYMPTDKKSTSPPPGQMTGAELQTLREACGLSREELGDLCNVAARTIKHWESGRAGVPFDVADLARRLDAMASLAANEAMQALRGTIEQAGRMPDDVVMVRYREAQDLAHYRPDMAGLPAALHGSIINRLRLALPWFEGFERVAVRVVWMQPDVYEAWRSACQLPDNEATRSQWADQQVDTQATPHRGDQPPA